MINFRDTHWIWDRSKGSQGVAFLGTDFNINKDVHWARESIPEALGPYFECIEIGLVPNLQGQTAMATDTPEGPLVLLDVRWLRYVANEGHWDALKEVMVHERHHVIQILEGRLIPEQAQGTVYWEGVKYDMSYVSAHYPYLPWEEEAFAVQAEWLVAAGHFDNVDIALSALYVRVEDNKKAA